MLFEQVNKRCRRHLLGAAIDDVSAPIRGVKVALTPLRRISISTSSGVSADKSKSLRAASTARRW
jgi:hypothetical protein